MVVVVVAVDGGGGGGVGQHILVRSYSGTEAGHCLNISQHLLH